MKSQQGFTLIELAIVLVIVTLLVGGLAMPLSAQIEARRISETRKTLEEAREAILGYAMNHSVSPTRYYLPCPDLLDDGNPATTNDGDGIEDRVGAGCSQEEGYLPWVTLGTASQDAWGNRLRYAVTPSFSNSSGFSNASSGTKQVCKTSTGGCPVGNVAQAVPVVIISYGPNGWGARNVNESTLRAPTSADELENTNSNDAFVYHPPSKAAADEFDDLVVWISRFVVISRVCPSPGGCP